MIFELARGTIIDGNGLVSRSRPEPFSNFTKLNGHALFFLRS
jgi:hypothetical protein